MSVPKFHDENEYEGLFAEQFHPIISTSNGEEQQLTQNKSNIIKNIKSIQELKNNTEILRYLRRPEPAVKIKSSRKKHLTYKGDPDIGRLQDIKNKYIPGSPSLGTVLNESINLSPVLKPLSKVQDRPFDCAPFFHCYDYENRVGDMDEDILVKQLLIDDLNGTYPIFAKQLEYDELKKNLKKSDRILHYLFGIDRTGYFELDEERTHFYSTLKNRCTATLRFTDRSLDFNISSEEEFLDTDRDFNVGISEQFDALSDDDGSNSNLDTYTSV
ncbi:hypothetical protein NCAS_0B04950 [Naumovozyma castellii]|uniref:Uncharacterized protein n=1 Tax=Naumovozyma castellii TaxID=27288 RepID=G0V9G3_NAUCA|nr:hypothetical protein NCAS_0B04950 [Naumovozyma castellii CBS 4309]CCC68579.1 hypothetical protein NCAS_0B04950 [Naumovozyma castellii CBS 4309]